MAEAEDQFEFVQQSWSNTVDFSQPNSGIDPIIGQSAAPLGPFLGAAPVSESAAGKPQLQLGGFVHLEGWCILLRTFNPTAEDPAVGAASPRRHIAP
jgi:hypothetical protein